MTYSVFFAGRSKGRSKSRKCLILLGLYVRYEPKGRGFESLQARQSSPAIAGEFYFCPKDHGCAVRPCTGVPPVKKQSAYIAENILRSKEKGTKAVPLSLFLRARFAVMRRPRKKPAVSPPETADSQ